MGNCQAIDNASLVIQHPSGGRIDKLYCPVNAAEIMKINPGHYVALLLTTTTTAAAAAAAATTTNSVRITRIKLLRPTDTLALGHTYRLITTQEVIQGLRAKKYEKMKKKQPESAEKEEAGSDSTRSDSERSTQVKKHERHRPRTTSSTVTSASTAKSSRAWHPSLHSIYEGGS